MGKVAIGIMCKTPAAGMSKTRLSPPLKPEECATLSSCFIRDLSTTIADLSSTDEVEPYAVYTPIGSELDLRRLLPTGFRLTPQCDGDFGARLYQGIVDLLAAGNRGAILVNSDSPTLPKKILRQAAEAVRQGDNVVLSPAMDGGYTLIGLSCAHRRLFEDIVWSTPDVYRATLARAAEINLPVVNVPGWYDVDDSESLQLLDDELSGKRLGFMPPNLEGAVAEATRRFMYDRQQALTNFS